MHTCALCCTTVSVCSVCVHVCLKCVPSLLCVHIYPNMLNFSTGLHMCVHVCVYMTVSRYVQLYRCVYVCVLVCVCVHMFVCVFMSVAVVGEDILVKFSMAKVSLLMFELSNNP